MPTKEKAKKIDDIEAMWGKSLLIVLTEYRGMGVAEVTRMRRELRTKGAEYHITKNTLLRRAAKSLGYEHLDEALSGPTAVAFVNEDLTGGTKALLDFAKTSKIMVIKNGVMGGKLISPDRLEAITKMPSKGELIAKMLGSLNMPTTNLVNVLVAPTRDLVNVLDAYRKKLEEGTSAA